MNCQEHSALIGRSANKVDDARIAITKAYEFSMSDHELTDEVTKTLNDFLADSVKSAFNAYMSISTAALDVAIAIAKEKS